MLKLITKFVSKVARLLIFIGFLVGIPLGIYLEKKFEMSIQDTILVILGLIVLRTIFCNVGNMNNWLDEDNTNKK